MIGTAYLTSPLLSIRPVHFFSDKGRFRGGPRGAGPPLFVREFFSFVNVCRMMMMMMNFIHVSMYLAAANWGHNIKIKNLSVQNALDCI